MKSGGASLTEKEAKEYDERINLVLTDHIPRAGKMVLPKKGEKK